MKALILIPAILIAWAAQSPAKAEDQRVSQKGRKFNVKQITVKSGDTIHFSNDDEFIHQIYVESQNFKFDSAESEPGHVIDLKMTQPGDYEVRCHIHPKMLLNVHVD